LFNNVSVILLLTVLLVEATGVCRENNKTIISYRQTFTQSCNGNKWRTPEYHEKTSDLPARYFKSYEILYTKWGPSWS
jgi:hypothetical protein